jgi:HK97 gp10 family phage protein
MSTIEFDDTAFKTNLATALAGMKLHSDSEAEALANAIANGAKQLCPVDTGRLRASIGVQAGSDSQGNFFDVGTYTSYAGFVEYGTRYMAAQPFMRPSILSATQSWKPQITP